LAACGRLMRGRIRIGVSVWRPAFLTQAVWEGIRAGRNCRAAALLRLDGGGVSAARSECRSPREKWKWLLGLRSDARDAWLAGWKFACLAAAGESQRNSKRLARLGWVRMMSVRRTAAADESNRLSTGFTFDFGGDHGTAERRANAEFDGQSVNQTNALNQQFWGSSNRRESVDAAIPELLIILIHRGGPGAITRAIARERWQPRLIRCSNKRRPRGGALGIRLLQASGQTSARQKGCGRNLCASRTSLNFSIHAFHQRQMRSCRGFRAYLAWNLKTLVRITGSTREC